MHKTLFTLLIYEHSEGLAKIIQDKKYNFTTKSKDSVFSP